MTKIPRNLSGLELCKRLKRLGYFEDRSKGDHLVLTTTEHGEGHVTVPLHTPIKIGTLSSILKKVARHHGMEVTELLERLGL